MLPLREVMRPELMVFDVQAGPKEDILRRLVAPLVSASIVRDPTRLLGSLLQREQMMTTGIGHGVAIPHPREPVSGMFTEPVIVFAVCPDGTDYHAIDDQFVRAFFLICATRIEVHLDLMAKVAWLIRQEEIERLKHADSASEVTALMATVSRRIEETPD
jgi:mannitol/fructose-specific phosphotransferase system IIA component (Ntr-type)